MMAFLGLVDELVREKHFFVIFSNFGFFTFLQFFRRPIKLKKRNFLLHKNF